MMENLYNNQLVSVIIPVYNAEKYIKETLQSALQQSYKPIEIICVDDCSKDGSAQLITDMQKKHSEIRYYCQEKNMGAAVARNTALQIAQGRYVAFLDSDDLWEPEKLNKQLSFMRNKQISFCYTAIEMMDENNRVLKGKRKIPSSINYKGLLRNTAIATSSVVVDRNYFGDFQMPLRRSGQDYATWLSLLRNGENAYGIDEVLVRYRVGSSSLSSNKFKSICQVWEIQVKNEGIHPVAAAYHTGWFILHALKKYLI